MAPELSPDGLISKAWAYVMGVQLTEKCDVYSFGVILLETMSLMCKKGRRRPPPKSHEQWVIINGQYHHNINNCCSQLMELITD